MCVRVCKIVLTNFSCRSVRREKYPFMTSDLLLERYRAARTLSNSTAEQEETLYHKRQRLALENLRTVAYKQALIQSKKRRHARQRSSIRLSTDIRREFQVDRQNQQLSPLHSTNKPLSSPVPVRTYPQVFSIRQIFSKQSIDKSIFNRTHILGQFDRKFLIGKHTIQSNRTQLILFDQHAVSERILLERLQNHFQQEHIRTNPFHLSEPTIIARNPRFLYSPEQITLLEQTGFIFSSISTQNLLIRAVPNWLLTFSQRQLDNIISQTIDTILRQTIQPSTTNIQLIMYETLKSLACHNAIKFNDLLSITECSHLLNELKSCSMPFICAHGRTSTALLWEYDLVPDKYQVDMIELAQQASIHKWLKES